MKEIWLSLDYLSLKSVAWVHCWEVIICLNVVFATDKPWAPTELQTIIPQCREGNMIKFRLFITEICCLGPLLRGHHLFKCCLCNRQTMSCYLNQLWPSSLTYIYGSKWIEIMCWIVVVRAHASMNWVISGLGNCYSLFGAQWPLLLTWFNFNHSMYK